MNKKIELLAAILVTAMVVVAVLYEGFEWTVNRIYVPPGKSLLLRYKGPLLFTWGNKYTVPGHFAARRRNRSDGKNARSRPALLLSDLVGADDCRRRRGATRPVGGRDEQIG